MSGGGSQDLAPVFIASGVLGLMLVFLGLVLYYGRMYFIGGAAETRREIARKKKEMELLIEMKKELGQLPAAEPEMSGALHEAAPEARTGSALAEAPPELDEPPVKQRQKEQWEIEAEESEYKPQ
ncbi:MAG: hypothetical protein ACREJQ_00235 [bacterium]